MSFLAGRLAGREAAYFVEESRQTISRYLEKKPQPQPASASSRTPASATGDGADILPEVLRHSLPPKLLHQEALSDYSSPVSTSVKWSILSPGEEARFYGASPDVMNPLRGFLSLPQVTFGPKRWQLAEVGNSVSESTANELRGADQQPSLTPHKIKAAAEGLDHIGKAFAGATAVIFASAALTFELAALTLQIHTREDIRVKGRDLVQPRMDTLKERLVPLRTWVDQVSKKWHLQMEKDIKEKPFVKELSKRFRAKRSE
ncbi:hypothetical protein V2J09_008693 [Rumex salicifolius]